MKIAFVTGSLEPGKDGVGDYTRTLATECARRGHATQLLSIAERSPVDGAPTEPGVTRMTAAEWRADDGARARATLEGFAADWTSLQFVPYAFDARGLFSASVGPLTQLMGNASRRHIFFHELWIGSHRGAALRARLTGNWQRRATRRLLNGISPLQVHTNTEYYRDALATIGCASSRLPIFGSVPRVAVGPGAKLLGVADGSLVCGMFGTLHPNWDPGAFLADLAALAAQLGRPAALVSAGDLGYGKQLFAQIRTQWRGRVNCVALGRLGLESLARTFGCFDFAVTSVPWNIAGKSSSVAALREHGLRVVFTDVGAAPRFPTKFHHEAEDDPGLLAHFRLKQLGPDVLEKTPPAAGVTTVADRFLEALHAAS